MKYIGAAFLAAVLLGAAAPPKDVTITVTGQSTLSRPADVATISLAVVTNDPVAQTATTANNSRYNDLRNRLHTLGIPDTGIRTVSYNLNYLAPPKPEPGAAVLQRPYPYPGGPMAGYTVSRQVQVKFSNLDLVGRVVDQAVAADVNNVYNVAYSISNYREIYAQALKAAVGDAQLQARAMASAADMHIVRIAAMQAGGTYAQPMIMRATMADSMGAPQIPTELPPGPLDINATVTVTYVIAP